MRILSLLLIVFLVFSSIESSIQIIPTIVTTWSYPKATSDAYEALTKSPPRTSKVHLDAVEAGCKSAEENPNITYVGFGGSPDEQGHVSLDSLIMDGDSMQAGSVAGLVNIGSAISVARAVMEHTKQTLLVGTKATKFALEMGFQKTNLTTPHSIKQWRDWKAAKCQPNYWKSNVQPNPKTSCGPYSPISDESSKSINYVQNNNLDLVSQENHDTIGVIAMDAHGNMAIGTSTNGLTHKIPGRVGDTPIVGAGGYVENQVGAAVGTGDGDIMMRFVLTYRAVDAMRNGTAPNLACQIALQSVKNAEKWSGAILAINKNGEFGAACVGFGKFPFVYAIGSETKTKQIQCFK